ncbi:hypothetical protein NIES2107_21920 [Nostoc carneum NIES-2107]|nr:hypothetical protein NIES2107_21920 [Nostoc carneum NIES-2107]
MHLHSTNESPYFPNLEDKKNNIEEQRERSMKVAVQQDDLQLLAKTLQEQLLAEVPSGGVFQVKCAVNKDGLMILIQHPPGLIADTSTIFQLIEDVIQSLPNQQERQVQCFLRVLGEKYPYTNRSLDLHQRVELSEITSYPHLPEPPVSASTNSSLEDSKAAGSRLIFPPIPESLSAASLKDEADSPFTPNFSAAALDDEDDLPFPPNLSAAAIEDEADLPFAPNFSAASLDDDTDSTYASSFSAASLDDDANSTYSSSFPKASFSDDIEEEEPFDPFAGAPDLSASKSKKLIKSGLIGLGVVGIIGLGIGGYVLLTPCLLSECKPVQTAEKLKTESRRSLRRAKSERELVAVQQQLQASASELASIPGWSPYSQQAEELRTSLSASSDKIDQVVKALQAAALATKKSQTPAENIEELQARQKLWRRAIAPLESISANSDFSQLAQVQLLSYRTSLQTVNQQLLVAERWVKKLSAAKAVANNATQMETTVKSLNDLQRVQFAWQVAVNALNSIPAASSEYQEAQQLLREYKPKLVTARNRTTKEQLAAKTYQQAVGAAKQAKVSEQKQQWQAAVTQWQQAVQSVKQIPNDSFQYLQAQSLGEPYSAALKEAQGKLEIANSLQQTRNDLSRTCTNGIRICNFTVDSKGITVRLTREYDLARSTLPNTNPATPNAVPGLSQHLQILQQALGVISDNAHLPLSVYDSQGKPVYTRSLEG